MNVGNVSLILSIVATTLAVLSFGVTLWRLWRDRPRLIFYVTKVNFHNRPDGKTFKMLQVKTCNIGFRPIILKKFIALGKSSSYQMGIHDEPAAAYGIEDQIFPTILNPGETLTFHPISISAL